MDASIQPPAVSSGEMRCGAILGQLHLSQHSTLWHPNATGKSTQEGLFPCPPEAFGADIQLHRHPAVRVTVRLHIGKPWPMDRSRSIWKEGIMRSFTDGVLWPDAAFHNHRC